MASCAKGYGGSQPRSFWEQQLGALSRYLAAKRRRS
jgi:hypothetical protein